MPRLISIFQNGWIRFYHLFPNGEEKFVGAIRA
jgi:hypothetical protein